LRLADATERAVSDRLDLARLEAEQAIVRIRTQAAEAAGHIVRGSAFLGAGAVLAVGGWFILMAAVIVLLRTWLRLDASIALVGGANVLIALILIFTGIATTRRARDVGSSRSGG
jgi:hypothetical protein